MSNIKNKSGLNQYSGTTNSLGLVNATCFFGNLTGTAASATTALNAVSATTAGANVGVGNGIYTGKTGTDLQFKSISGGTNIQLIDNGDTITISGTSPGGQVSSLYFSGNEKVVAVTDGACTCGQHSVDGTLNILNGPGGNTHFGHLGTNNYISHSDTGSTFFRTHTGPTGTNYVTFGCFDSNGHHHHTDSNCAIFGTGDDMRLYHDGFNSYVCNVGGDLRIDSNNNWGIYNAGEVAMFGIINGCVQIYYNGVSKIRTAVYGACIVGTSCATSCFVTTGTGNRFCGGTGCGTAVQWTNTSDRRCKKCIEPYNCGLERVNQLNPVYYQWKHDNTEDIGFIAQDVVNVEPKLVMGDEKDGYGLNYGKFTAITVKAIQELSCEVKTLREEFETLKNK